jgi:hypothetical protein
MTATNATVTGLTARTENVGHKLCVNNSSPELFDDLHTEKINCCGTVRPNRTAMPTSIGQRMKLKWGDTDTMVGIHDSHGMERCNINMLINMLVLPAEGNLNKVH